MAEAFEKRINVPEGVEAEVSGASIRVAHKGTEVKRTFRARNVVLEKSGSMVLVRAVDGRKKSLSTANTIASHIRNMIAGVMQGFEYCMEVVYSHFPMSVVVKANTVEISNIGGAKKPKVAKIVGNTTVEVKGKNITVRSADKEAAGQTAANIETAAKTRNRDTRIFQDGIYIVSKPKVRAK